MLYPNKNNIKKFFNFIKKKMDTKTQNKGSHNKATS
jgi:hypothetical protein